MIPAEFTNNWLPWHFSRFSGAASWLSKFPTKAAFPGQPVQKDITNAWFQILKPCEVQHAKAASQLLATGEASFPERGYDCHPRAVRMIAMQLAGKAKSEKKRTKVGGQVVYDCFTCFDTGIVPVWHPTALRFFYENFLDDPPSSWVHWYTDPRWQEARRAGRVYEGCAMRCSCEAATGMRLPVPVFNPEVHFERVSSDPRTAIERLRKHRLQKMGNEDF